MEEEVWIGFVQGDAVNGANFVNFPELRREGGDMTAGRSAEVEARRQLALAAQYEAAAAEARATAGKFGVASVTEKRVMQVLAPLAALDFTFLADRRWPGSRHAQVDLVAVGPQGVFIIDTKAWKDVSIVGDRIFRGDDDVTDSLLGLSDLVDVAEAEFAEIGLAPGEVHATVVLAGHQNVKARVGIVDITGEKDVLRYIAGRGRRLSPTQVDQVLAKALSVFPPVTAPPPPTMTLPTVPVAEPPEPEPLLLTEEEVSDAILAGVMAAPIEDWMSFLHPDQAKLVRRSFNGPSRIRGAAGTGKTVVGLHRAAYIARTRPGRILFTTFVRTLPEVLSRNLERMAPEAVGRVDFMGVHRFATRLLRERGVPVPIDSGKSDAAFGQAWAAVDAHSPLREKGLTKKYWRDEIDYVIKGRGISTFGEYEVLPRTGRGYSLGAVQRRAVWDLYVDYDKRLRSAGVVDFADVILMAEAELKRQPLETPYVSVIVDEAQDLSCAMVRMLHSLVGDETDGLTLIGDGQQSIYPGGYTLAEAGVSVANRGVVLDTNYRNTAQILDFAHQLIEGSEYADIEGAIAKGSRPAHVPRRGHEPEVVRCGSETQHDRLLVEKIRSAISDVATGLGDVGVLGLNSWALDDVKATLKRAAIPFVDLEEYDGNPVEAVKIGTIKRAKGLEFKQVLLARVSAAEIDATRAPEDGAESERWELRRRELFVGATRARDGLWVGVLAN